MGYKLHYFENRGAAETIRQIFAVTGQPYEDIRHSREEWAKLKSGEFFDMNKALLQNENKLISQAICNPKIIFVKIGNVELQLEELVLEMPFHQMPVLEMDGKLLPQSLAIARYLSKKFGIAGKTAYEAAMVDAIADQIKDYVSEIANGYSVLLGFTEGDLVALRKNELEPAREKHFSIFNKILAESKSGYLVGDSLTFPDLTLSEHVWCLNEKMPGYFNDYPEVMAHYKKIRSNANLKKWFASRPVTKA